MSAYLSTSSFSVISTEVEATELVLAGTKVEGVGRGVEDLWGGSEVGVEIDDPLRHFERQELRIYYSFQVSWERLRRQGFSWSASFDYRPW